MLLVRRTLGFFLLWGVLALPAPGQRYVGKAQAVLDGDTIHLLRETGQIVRVKLYGVDAPERGQAYGRVAARAVQKFLYRKRVRAGAEDTDPDGRHLFVVEVDDRILNEHLLRKGLAWWDRKQAPRNERLRRLERRARRAHRGLWSQPNPVPPWEWRDGEFGS